MGTSTPPFSRVWHGRRSCCNFDLLASGLQERGNEVPAIEERG
jgi:hypothetical protein